MLSLRAVVDVALVAIVVELVLIVALGRWWKKLIGGRDLFGQLAAGALLLLALRNHVTGGDDRITLLWIAASLPAHLYDLWRRIRRTSTGEQVM